MIRHRVLASAEDYGSTIQDCRSVEQKKHAEAVRSHPQSSPSNQIRQRQRIVL